MEILELKNMIFETNSLASSNRSLTITEKIIGELEHSSMKVITQEHRKRKYSLKQNMKYLWNSIKHSKTHVIGVPEGKERKNWAGN